MSGNAYSLKHAFQTDDQQNKNTKKIKLRLKMLVGLQPIYFLNVLDMSSKSSCATICHFKKSKFSFTKTSRLKFLDVKPTHFAIRIAAPLGNNRSTAEELGDRVLYIRNTSTKSVDTLNRKYVLFWKLQKQSQWCCWFAVDFNFLPQMFAVRNRFANLNLGSAICAPVCGSAQHCIPCSGSKNQIEKKEHCIGQILQIKICSGKTKKKVKLKNGFQLLYSGKNRWRLKKRKNVFKYSKSEICSKS